MDGKRIVKIESNKLDTKGKPQIIFEMGSQVLFRIGLHSADYAV